jgi:hypothetical protein
MMLTKNEFFCNWIECHMWGLLVDKQTNTFGQVCHAPTKGDIWARQGF